MPLVGTPRGALSASSGWRAKQFSIISAGLWLCALLLLAAPPQVLAFGKTPVARRVSDLQFEDLGPACVSTSLAGGAIKGKEYEEFEFNFQSWPRATQFNCASHRLCVVPPFENLDLKATFKS